MFLKKIIIAACMAILGCGSVFAQHGKQAIGGNLSYGTEIESGGIGLKYQFTRAYMNNIYRVTGMTEACKASGAELNDDFGFSTVDLKGKDIGYGNRNWKNIYSVSNSIQVIKKWYEKQNTLSC